jgi:hypothetical protein
MHANRSRDVLRVVIVGDIDKRAAAGALDTVFGGLRQRKFENGSAS